MPKSRPITNEELETIRKSVFIAGFRIASWRMGLFKRDRQGRYTGLLSTVNLTQKEILRAYRWVEGRVIFNIGNDSVRKVFEDAILNGDADFFRKLARAMSQEPRLWSSPSEQNRLELFLIDHWADQRDGLPELFYLTPNALWIACTELLGLKNLTRDALRTTVHRLGLKGFKRQRRDAVFIGGKWTFPPSYRE